MTREQFLAMACEFAIENEEKTGIPAALQVAQAAIETGWGAKAPGNNYFGIKSNSLGAEGEVVFQTTEFINGKPVKAPLGFASYSSASASFADHARLITTGKPYARAWLSYQSNGNMDAFIKAVSRVYATDPNYAKTLKAVMFGKRVRDGLVAARTLRNARRREADLLAAKTRKLHLEDSSTGDEKVES